MYFQGKVCKYYEPYRKALQAFPATCMVTRGVFKGQPPHHDAPPPSGDYHQPPFKTNIFTLKPSRSIFTFDIPRPPII